MDSATLAAMIRELGRNGLKLGKAGHGSHADYGGCRYAGLANISTLPGAAEDLDKPLAALAQPSAVSVRLDAYPVGRDTYIEIAARS